MSISNPMTAEWTGPYGGLPPWDKVAPQYFAEAFEAAIAAWRFEIAAITSQEAPPTFDNTIVPLEDSARMLDRVRTLFDVMTSNMSSPEYEALDREWSPRIQMAFDEVVFDGKLFARISAVRTSSGLDTEQQRVVQRTYDALVRSGAQLGPAQKIELGRINEELAGLFSDFGTKVLADENTWLTVSDERELAGVPASLVSSYGAAAEERGLSGVWAIVNTRSSVDPLLMFADDRALRERAWVVFKQRGENANANNTQATVERIVKLRADRARLLGYKSHAHWRMEDSMAGDPARAEDLMRRVWPAAVARVRQEVADMTEIAAAEGASITIEPWDYLYYAEKVRRERYALDQNEIKPYFELNNVIAASMWTAAQLFGLEFREVTGSVPVFHRDVRVWEVEDNGRFIGLFYGDYFARAGKRSGAWATSYRSHESFTGKVTTVLASNSNNFVKGAAGEASLISLDDAETLFHEFGHSVHSLLSEVKYPSLSPTPRDFVEFPSQVLEHWVLARPVLDRFARHYETREPMPDDLVDKIKASEKFNQGYATVEYLSSALVDMAMHTNPNGDIDMSTYEADALASIGMPHEISMRHRLSHFGHLFTSDGYSAGYYSYLWAEVMDADAWLAFEATGNVFDRELAERMRRYILAPGNSTDRAEAYRQFRGNDPDVNALMQLRGFPTGVSSP